MTTFDKFAVACVLGGLILGAVTLIASVWAWVKGREPKGVRINPLYGHKGRL